MRLIFSSIKGASLLMILAFPVGFIGAVAKSYYLHIYGDTDLNTISLWDWLLIGSVTAIVQAGFLVVVHLNFFAVPEDLFTGPMFDRRATILEGSPAIFRQALGVNLCLIGFGLGYMLSAPVFKVNVLGLGLSFLIPGALASILIFDLWRRVHRK